MRTKFSILLLFLSQLLYCQHIFVLGIAQDGGFPHIGCQNECQKAHKDPSLAKYVTSLALVDPSTKKWWLLEASPDMDKQLQYFQELTNGEYPYLPSGIFLTHAHIGHYTGLMFLGKEALGAKDVKVYALPRMVAFLQSNGPWSQLVSSGNINLITLPENEEVKLEDDLHIKAFTVPHRDEYSETAGFRINKRLKSYVFIPDIDKWSKWNQSIVELLKEPKIEHAFLDATFYADGELPNRAMSEVPHPFVKETMSLFEQESRTLRRKIVFIHFNHTNPLLFNNRVRIKVQKEGYGVAEQGRRYE